MTTVHTLASGSSGNAVLISCGSTHLLLDAGISCRRITAALREVGLAPDELVEHYGLDRLAAWFAENGMEAVRLFRKTPDAFDIVIMDVMMPELDGFSAVAEIKKIASPAVIMLSARGEEYDKIHGFELGVDDYVVKPFSPKELMMRVAAVMSRVQRTAIPKHELFRAEGLTIDFTGRIVTVDGVRADLSPKEYDLLFYMVNNRNIALTREMLITNVWGYDFYGDDRTLDTHIKLLRRSLGPYSKFIVTLRGVGYRFETHGA